VPQDATGKSIFEAMWSPMDKDYEPALRIP
jgi:hypothetical protein